MVECGFNMAASNTLSAVNGHTVQRRSVGSAGSVGQSNTGLSFQCQPVQNPGGHSDSARLHTNGNCGDNKQCRGEFLSAKDASRRKRVCCSGSFDPFLVMWCDSPLHAHVMNCEDTRGGDLFGP